MKAVDSKNFQRFAERLFPCAEQREEFVQALLSDIPPDKALVWTKPRPTELPFLCRPRYCWQHPLVDVVPAELKPGQHPLHAHGHYYCQDPSSAFAASVLSAIDLEPDSTIIDCCAAPGGKAVAAWAMLRPKILVCNEVIRSRVAPLLSNLRRCGVREVEVVSQDVSRLAANYKATGSLVIVDAPCSGQSLLRKKRAVQSGFHPATINMNANRQRKILAHTQELVKPGGFLAYMTCTFSREENERVLEWFISKFPSFVPIVVPVVEPFRSKHTALPCYRLWPNQINGAGAFVVVLRLKVCRN